MDSETLKRSPEESAGDKSDGGWDSLKDVPFAGAVQTGELSAISLEQTDKMGGKVDAFSATARDQSGNSIKTSNIIASERANVSLENGNMVSREDFAKSLENFIAENTADEARFVRIEPPKQFSDSGEMIADMMVAITDDNPTIELAPEPKIVNQDVRQVTINSGGQQVRSSDLFLGKDRVELPNGEYLPESAVNTALANYMMQVPEKKAGVLVPERHATIKTVAREKGKKIAGAILPLVLAVALTLSLSGDSAAGAKNTTIAEPTSPIVEIAAEKTPTLGAIDSLDNINTAASKSEEQDSQVEERDLAAEAHEKFMAGINIGETYAVPAGVAVHESSDYDYGGANATGEIGKNLRPGDYMVESFSILDPATHQTNNVTWENGTNINDYLEQVANKYGTTVDKLEAKLHLGTMSGGAAGWVELGDLEQATTINNQGE